LSSFPVAADKTIDSQSQPCGEPRRKIEYDLDRLKPTRKPAMFTNRNQSKKPAQTKRQGQPQPTDRTRRTLRMESLEGRSLMAADILLSSSGVLNISGSAGNDQIEVADANVGTGGWYDGGSTQLRVTITNRDTGQVVSSQIFSKDAVKNLVIEGGDGNDVINNYTNKPSMIHAGDGNDTVQGGSGFDKITGAETITSDTSKDCVGGPYFGTGVRDGVLFVEGSQGDDDITAEEVAVGNGWGGGTTNMLRVTRQANLYGPGYSYLFDKSQVRHIVFEGGEGTDHLVNRTNLPATMFGDGGVDTLEGGSAADVIYGGADTDFIYGRGGNDVIRGDRGDDRIWGGADNDQIFGGEGNDWLVGEAGSDYIYGEGGTDDLFGGSDKPADDNAIDYLYGGDGRSTDSVRDNFHVFKNTSSNATADVLVDKTAEDLLIWEDLNAKK
jgi:Ca2+-binding RTX toxin-like protein